MAGARRLRGCWASLRPRPRWGSTTWRFFRETDLEIRHTPKAFVLSRCRTTLRVYFSQQMRNGRALVILRAKYPVRLPWSRRQKLRAWSALAGFAWIATRAALH
jgi:hypothetical protein